MPINVNGTTTNDVKVNGVSMNEVKVNGVIVWTRNLNLNLFLSVSSNQSFVSFKINDLTFSDL